MPAKKRRIRSTHTERALREYAEKILPQALTDWHWGNIYVNAQKEAGAEARYRQDREDRLNASNPADTNSINVLAGIAAAVARSHDRADTPPNAE